MGTLAIDTAIAFAIIHIFDTFSYTIRLNAAKSKQLALSLSLFNTFALITRAANMFLLPSIGILTDYSVTHHFNPIWMMRQIIFGSTVGTLVGLALIPTFLKLFGKAVDRLAVTGSAPALILQSLSFTTIKRISRHSTLPRRRLLAQLRYRHIPKRILLLNMVITAINIVGVLAANYASTLDPANSSAIVQSSAVITSAATILFTLLVDPFSARLTDQTIRGERTYGDLKALVTMLLATKVIGTLLAQVLFTPASVLLAFLYQHIV